MDGEFKATNIPSKASIDLLSGIVLGFSILATVIMGFLLDPLKTYYISYIANTSFSFY